MTTYRIFVSHPHWQEAAQTGLPDLEEARAALAFEIENAERLEAFAFNLPEALRQAYRADAGEAVSFAGLRLSIQEEV